MPKTFLASYLPSFHRDIQEVVAWSEDQFGALAADRYGLLIRQALRDVVEEPTRPGAKARPDLGHHAYIYHLMFSRERVIGERVKAPRTLCSTATWIKESSLRGCCMTAAILPGMCRECLRTSRHEVKHYFRHADL